MLPAARSAAPRWEELHSMQKSRDRSGHRSGLDFIRRIFTAIRSSNSEGASAQALSRNAQAGDRSGRYCGCAGRPAGTQKRLDIPCMRRKARRQSKSGQKRSCRQRRRKLRRPRPLFQPHLEPRAAGKPYAAKRNPGDQAQQNCHILVLEGIRRARLRRQASAVEFRHGVHEISEIRRRRRLVG